MAARAGVRDCGFALATARPLSGVWLLLLAASLFVVGPLADRDYRSLLARIAGPSIIVFCGLVAGIALALATGQQAATEVAGAIQSIGLSASLPKHKM
jgi:hypothetical protein